MLFVSSAFPNIYGAFLYIWGQQGFMFVSVCFCVEWGWDLKSRLLWNLGFIRKFSLFSLSQVVLLLKDLHFLLFRILLLKIAYLFFFFLNWEYNQLPFFGSDFGEKNRTPITNILPSSPPHPPKFVRIWSIMVHVINSSMVLLLYQMYKGSFYFYFLKLH